MPHTLPAGPLPTPRPAPGATPNPAEPTLHPAGSGDKVKVLVLRAALGLPLFHPLDSRLGLSAPATGRPAGKRQPGRHGSATRMGNRWRARIYVGPPGRRRRRWLGYYATREEALAAAAQAALTAGAADG